MTTTTKSGRRLQQRTQQTRGRLISAAVDAFAASGFDGASVAAIEKTAGVQRGLAAYHFGDKDALWRAAVDKLCAKVADAMLRAGARPSGPGDDPLEAAISAFIRASAETPALQRIIFQESGLMSDRMDHLIDAYVEPIFARAFSQPAGRTLGVHDYYILLGAAALPFAAPQEARRVWNTDPFTEDFIAAHIRQVTAMAQCLRAAGERAARAEH